MMPIQFERRFEIHSNGDASASCCKCRRVFFINSTAAATGRTLPDTVIAKKFAAKGWSLGSSKKKDTCPDCVAARRGAKIVVKKEPKLAKDPAIIDVIPAVNGASEMPPREMTREDRRIIFSKLEDTYVDESTGYSPGWNDIRVAEDLNCPRKWVETIREENFGPQRTEQSADVVEFNRKLAEVTTILNDLADQVGKSEAAFGRLLDQAHGQITQLRAEIKKIVGR